VDEQNGRTIRGGLAELEDGEPDAVAFYRAPAPPDLWLVIDCGHQLPFELA
jgi:hypothetical protein